MGLVNDCLESSLEKEMEDLLQPFIQESDYIYGNFDYKACIRRVVDSLVRAQDRNREIACGHTKGDLWKEQHANAKEYCTVCRLHQDIEDAQTETAKWRTAVEDALGLEHDDENHTPEWAHDIILQVREIGNRK